MELLIIKSKKDYIRVKGEQYFIVGLDKASVFPLEQLAMVKLHESNLKNQGFQKTCIKRLILTEKEL